MMGQKTSQNLMEIAASSVMIQKVSFLLYNLDTIHMQILKTDSTTYYLYETLCCGAKKLSLIVEDTEQGYECTYECGMCRL